MSNVKISALPAVTTVVPGVDVLPLVSGGITTKATPNAIVNASVAGQTSLSFYGGTWSLANSTTISAASTKTLTFNGGAGTNGLVLDASNNVGIGTSSPVSLLHVNSTSASAIATVQSTTYAIFRSKNSSRSVDYASDSTGGYIDIAAAPFRWYNGATEYMRLDPSGNLGLGVTPSGWGTSGSAYKAFQYGASGFLSGRTGNEVLYLGSNAYQNGTNWIYALSGNYSTLYQQDTGYHRWYTAPSGTAGDTFTFTQAMTLDASSNLTISGATATKASGTTWANPSDTRLKDNQQFYTKGLDELLQIVVKTWEFNGKGGSAKGAKGLGVIADEIELVLPESVDVYSAKLNDEDDDETEIKRFDASEVIWLLVNSVKELSAQNNALEARLEALEGAK